jgi:hypothetical protein
MGTDGGCNGPAGEENHEMDCAANDPAERTTWDGCGTALGRSLQSFGDGRGDVIGINFFEAAFGPDDHFAFGRGGQRLGSRASALELLAQRCVEIGNLN